MPRHSWKASRQGYVKCVKCGLEVKRYKMKRGGLPKCKENLENAVFLSKTLRSNDGEECKYCYIFEEEATLPYCLACGRIIKPRI